MRKTRVPLRSHWNTNVLYTWFVPSKKRNRTLGLIIGPTLDLELFTLGALEVPYRVDAVQEVLDSHAHEHIGSYSSLETAKSVAHVAAGQWLQGAAAAELCNCVAIEPPLGATGPSRADDLGFHELDVHYICPSCGGLDGCAPQCRQLARATASTRYSVRAVDPTRIDPTEHPPGLADKGATTQQATGNGPLRRRRESPAT